MLGVLKLVNMQNKNLNVEDQDYNRRNAKILQNRRE